MNSFEAEIVAAIQKISTPVLDWVFRIITVLGDVGAVLIAIAVILLFFGAKKAFKYGVIVGLSAGIGFLVKVTVQRPRPFDVSDAVVSKVTEHGFSFISGHTITATVTAIFLCLCILKLVKNKWARASIISAFVLLTLAVGFSRVYLGVHYISDIIGAIVLGAVLYGIISYVFEKCFKKVCELTLRKKSSA